ncbi:MAG: hypothetical protein ABSE52_01595 [Candidatus Dormibacteria bacterium]
MLLAFAAACDSTSPASPSVAPSGPATATATATAPPATATATPVAVVGPGAADPVTAVEEVAGTGTPGTVGQESGCTKTLIAQPCSMTLRLATRIEANPFNGTGGGAAWECRCQGGPGTWTFTLISQTGATALVSETFPWTPSTSLRWTALQVDGQWYADDQDTGCSTTSIYSSAYDFDSSQTAPTC